MKTLSQMMYPWIRKYPLNFGSNPDPESVSGIRTPDPDHIHLGGRMRSMTVRLPVFLSVCLLATSHKHVLIGYSRKFYAARIFGQESPH